VQRPILVTGAHRSGTTWVGAMLALSPAVGLIHEPFSPVTPRGVSGGPFERFFQYVCAENEERYAPHLERALRFSYDLRRQLPTIRSPRVLARTGLDLGAFTVNRVRRARPLLKDPIAVFSSEWLASRFGAQVVVLIRHPAAFASSLVRLGWRHNFGSFVDQPLLLRDHLDPFAEEIRDFTAHERDSLDQAVLLWRLIYATVTTFRERHPEWTFLRHEDLSLEPVPGFESLFATLEVKFDARIRRRIAEHSGEENPDELRRSHDVRLNSRANVDAWRRRLSADQIERIRAGTADVAPAFYGDEDW
jgi:sulfotransferase family protein